MTLLRRLALKISHTVVRFASPGSKEWAEGLAGEVAFVQGDWAALGWALGSARVLVDYREAPIASLADLSATAEKFAAARENSFMGVWIIIYLIQALTYALEFIGKTAWPQRVGCGLGSLGCITLAIPFFRAWRGRRLVPPPTDEVAVLRFYKTELERACKLPRSPKGWLLGFGITALFVGLTLSAPGGTFAHRIIATSLGLVWVGLMLLCLQTLRLKRRRLERLNALLVEKP